MNPIQSHENPAGRRGFRSGFLATSRLFILLIPAKCLLLCLFGCTERPFSRPRVPEQEASSQMRPLSRAEALADKRLSISLGAGMDLYRAAENKRTLTPTVASAVTARSPSAVTLANENWERAATHFKDSLRELIKSPTTATAQAASRFRGSLQGADSQDELSVLETVEFYESKWRLGNEPSLEELRRDFFSLHTLRPPAEDPAIRQIDQAFD